MTLPITIVDSASTSTSGESGQSVITGTPTTGSFAEIVLQPNGRGTVGIAISGTFTGTLAFEGTPDGVSFATLDTVVQGINGTVQSTTQVGLFQVAAAGLAAVRVRATATITGTAQVGFTQSLGNDVQHMVLLNAGALDVTIGNVGGLAAAGDAPSGNPLLVGGWDGTNVQIVATDTSGRVKTIGAAASGSAVAGNPVLVAGQDGTDARTLLTDTSGRMEIVGAAAAGAAIAGSPVQVGGSDGTDARALLLDATGRSLSGNNIDTAALLTFAAAGAGTTNSADQTNYNGRGIKVGLNLTTMTSASIVVTIQGKDAASGTYYTLLASASLSSTGFTLLEVYPGVTAASNTAASASLPRTWRVSATITGASAAVTGTVGASVIQ
jgi:hypothetical protein